MQRPKCRLCGALHYANEPHAEFDKFDTKHSMRSFSRGSPKPKVKDLSMIVPEGPIRSTGRAKDRIEELEAEVRQLKRLLADANAKLANTANAGHANAANKPEAANAPANTANSPKDRKAYMRELMRKKRAEAKRKAEGEQDFKG